MATPLIHLWEYEGLVYLGETAAEPENAVQKALSEPVGRPLRQQRRGLAENHSLGTIGSVLERILG